MPRKIIFFIKSLLLSLVIIGNIFAAEISIIPLKKPILDEEVKKQKISQGILKPKPKPSQKKEEVKIVTVKKNKKKINFLIPKSKPLIVKSEKSVVQKRSKYYSQKDYDIAKKSIQAMEKSQWTTALKNSKNAKDKSIYNFIQWRHLLTTGNQATFYDYMTFIQNNKHYPRISRIKYLAEQKLSTDKISPKKIINWFGVDEPLSGYGMLVLGESFIQTGDNEKGIALIKRGWITAELSRASMKSLSKKYRKYLDSKDYINRADYLAWENKYWDLKRMLPYLPKDYQLLYTARQILMSKSYGVDQAIKNVPQKFKNDAGLNHDRLKWRRKRGRIDSSLEILFSIKNNKDYLVRPDKWWVERAIMTRALIYKNKYETAYKVASQHSLDKGSEFAEAEWLSGWIALSFLNDPILAVDHFNNFYQNVSYPISLARGAYWLGRSYEKIGDKRQSEDWYREATKYLTTYYGQLAFLKINPSQNFELEEQADVEDDYRKYFYNKELVKITHLLNELNKDKYTKNILRHLANDNIASGSEILAAELATNISRYDFAIQISKLASYEKRFHNTFNYPIISVPQYVNGRKIPETAFILSLIRQESEFDMRANSHVGAQGLMQIMPYTAKLVAKQAKLPYSKSRLTSDPEYNINLGSHYIAGLILQYDGAYPFATAAYNAGPKRVKHWKKINKDPQKKQIDFVDWVELIPFKETRNYVQRVMENYNVYRYILEKKPIKIKDFFKDQPLF
ncbi:lytic transglycosylase domain-containing protein [Candidatus Pelagibacter communis]|uniref:Putative soluble lytic murein transglycosylase (Slt) n=1 Tax=Pelagibacter ubique (strain HTCC1062) TaxID=335992 RepID=Q4FLS0_PELUB|nr:lytic transglycosylase domain-containing protein [Candidatus Pelagibacter ubique]AAZ21868.1 putative soluble lytic murein transglycosylase precursor (slt) [Candidatus Pelagibacter ubique HTCC1062]